MTDDAVSEILERSDLRAEAVAALPHLEREAKREAGADGVRRVVGRRFGIYPPQELSEAEWAAWWADYEDACEDIPISALEAGMLDWVKDPASQFMPKPGELRARALNVQNKATLAAYRARLVAEHRDPAPALNPYKIQPPETRKVPDERSREAVAAMMESYREQAKRADRPPPIPPVSGPVDQGGVTPLMRALIARRKKEKQEMEQSACRT